MTMQTSFDVQISHSAYLGYPQAFNPSIAFINALTIHTNPPTLLRDVTLELRIRSFDMDLIEPISVQISQLNGTTEYTHDSFTGGELKLVHTAQSLNNLLAVSTIQPGVIEVTVRYAGTVVCTKQSMFDVVPAHTWTWQDHHHDYALMLAAYVLPHHPAITQLRTVATRMWQALAQSGSPQAAQLGAPSWSGYQLDDAHVDRQVAMLYYAMSSLRITYVNPPANWDLEYIAKQDNEVAQLVRTPQQVLVEKFGTCLDTTVVLAAALEDIGIHPIIFLIPGHAFVGYWRTDIRLQQAVHPLATFMNYIDSGLVGLIETTSVTQSKIPFEQAALDALEILRTNASILQHAADAVAIDVVAAKSMYGIKAIPVRVENGNGDVSIIMPPERVVVAPAIESTNQTRVTTDTHLPKRIAQWRNQLLDLSITNRLINFKMERDIYVQIPMPMNMVAPLEDMLQAGQGIEIHGYGSQFSDPERAYQDYQRFLVDRGQANTFDLAVFFKQTKSVFAHIKPGKFQQTMRRIVRSAKSITQQTGANQLYLALGSLVWTTQQVKERIEAANRRRAQKNAQPSQSQQQMFPDENTTRPTNEANLQRAKDERVADSFTLPPGYVRSPLVLVPITIRATGRGQKFVMQIDESSETVPNYTLIEKLRREVNVDLPDLYNLPKDASGIDFPRLIQSIRQQIATARLEFRVDETCVLGFFDFGNFLLWQDLGRNHAHYMRHPLIKHMVEHTNEPYIEHAADDYQNSDLDELISTLPIPADSSQVEAIQKGLAKQSFVLQGPPGTGKSQTISNLMIKAMHQGQRVLFITEKAKAADVVYKRIRDIRLDEGDGGLESLILNIHSKDSKPETVNQQIMYALEMNIQADRTAYDIAKQKYERNIHELKNYPERLHHVGKFGYSIYSAYDRLMALQDGTSTPLPNMFFFEKDKNDLHNIVQHIKDVQNALANVGVLNRNEWSFMGDSVTQQTLSDSKDHLQRYTEVLYTIYRSLSAHPHSQKLLREVTSLNDVAVIRAIADPDAIEYDKTRQVATPNYRQLRQELRTQIQTVRQYVQSPVVLNTEGLRVQFAPLIQKYYDAARQLLFRRSAMADAQRAIEIYFAKGGFADFAKVADLFTHIQAQQAAAQSLWQHVQRHPHMQLPTDWSPLVSEHIAVLEQELNRIDKFVGLLAGDTVTITPSMKEWLTQATVTEREMVAQYCTATKALFDLLGATPHTIEYWRRGVPFGQQLERLVPEMWQDVHHTNALHLLRWVVFNNALQPLRSYGFVDFCQAIAHEQFNYRQLSEIFDRSFLQSHLQRLISDAYLDHFDGDSHNQVIEDFEAAYQELRKHIPALAVEDILERRQLFIRQNIQRINELKRALQAQKRRLKVRELLTNFADVVSDIMPCTIASPSSVAMLLELTERRYDLVIFDEASMIRVTHAICGIGRADAVIVVGDSKQMPPTSIAEIALDDDGDEDDAIVTDEESILSECVALQMPSQMLTWHYRSEDELLIAYSNTNYYDGKLNAFPSPKFVHTDPSITFTRVQGRYIRNTAEGREYALVNSSGEQISVKTNTNPIEAIAVAEKAVELLTNPETAHQSVGILTLNLHQSGLISEILTGVMNSEIVQDAINNERLFVSNLEEMQGEEADTILFSVAFSANQAGVLPLNFGPMNKVGGERRLNVAITRARKRVHVFCSFDPETLQNRVGESRSVALTHLAGYLMLAKYGPDAVSATNTRRSGFDRYRDAIASRLRTLGYTVTTDVGLTDFKIDIVAQDENERIVGILLDGPRWKQRKTVNDRDVFPLAMLARMGWPAIIRIWLPMWISNAEYELQRIRDAMANQREHPSVIRQLEIAMQREAERHQLEIEQQRLESERQQQREVERQRQQESEQQREAERHQLEVEQQRLERERQQQREAERHQLEVEQQRLERERQQQRDVERQRQQESERQPVNRQPSQVVIDKDYTSSEWVPWPLRMCGDRSVIDNLSVPAHREQVLQVMQEILNTEAPIQPERLGRLIGNAFGLARVTEARRDEILRLRMRGTKRDNEGFIYLIDGGDDVHTYTSWRYHANGNERDFDEISLIEIANAMRTVVYRYGRIEYEVCFRETLELFSIRRLTENVRLRLTQAAKYALRNNRFRVDNLDRRQTIYVVIE